MELYGLNDQLNQFNVKILLVTILYSDQLFIYKITYKIKSVRTLQAKDILSYLYLQYKVTGINTNWKHLGLRRIWC